MDYNRHNLRKVTSYLKQSFVAQMYKGKFSTVGTGLNVIGKPQIHGKGQIIAGINLELRAFVFPIEIYSAENALIKFGNNVLINQGTTISALNKIEIGDETLIGDQTTIYDSDWHGIDGNPNKTSPVIIGNHVWVCARVTILKGVEIGDNSIVAAGSVVLKSVEKNSIVGGNPARKIGTTQKGWT
jgi:acetyltransferase-like isoleucine patch superfamily enzyme